MHFLRSEWLCKLAGIALATGCDTASRERAGTEAQSDALTATLTVTVPWGSDAQSLTVRRPGNEIVADGPNAIAIDTNGRVLVLDRLAGRVVSVTADGRLSRVVDVPFDAEDLAAKDAIVAFSPVRATAWLYEHDGRSAGEIAVPRVLRDVHHVELGLSRNVLVRTGYQEQLSLGSSAAPLPLAVTLSTKKEGAARLADGRGVRVRVDGDRAVLEILAEKERERTAVAARYDLGAATAARVVGVDGELACVRLERVTSTPAIDVARRAVCVASDGRVLLRTDLPPPWHYLPRSELAVGGGMLAHIQPSDRGLVVRRWAIPRAEVRP
jgi:hypothetical protein